MTDAVKADAKWATNRSLSAIMPDLQRGYWRFFNVAARIVAAGFLSVGAIFVLWGLSLVLDPKATIGDDGVPSADPWLKASVLVVGLVVSGLGVLFVKSRRYRPDPGDSPFAGRKNLNKQQHNKERNTP